MKKIILAITMLMALSITAPPVSAATAEDVSGGLGQCATYYSTQSQSEYIVFNSDSTGMTTYGGNAFTINWTYDGATLSFTDSMGNQFSGTYENGTIQGDFHGMSRSYTIGDNAPVMSLSPSDWGAGLSYVTDCAGILTGYEVSDLSERASGLSGQYGCGIYTVIVDDMYNYTDSGSIQTLAEEIRAGYGLGYGSGGDCVMLLLSMSERDYDIMAYGDFGNRAITDYGKTRIYDAFSDYFSEDDWYYGIEAYMEECGYLLGEAAAGSPVESRTASDTPRGVAAILAVILAFIIAIIISVAVRSGMKSVRAQTSAAAYVPKGGADITYRKDRFAYITETAVYSPRKSGGGTSIGGGGASHSSGKF